MGLSALDSDSGFIWSDGSPVSKSSIVPAFCLIFHVCLRRQLLQLLLYKLQVTLSLYYPIPLWELFFVF